MSLERHEDDPRPFSGMAEINNALSGALNWDPNVQPTGHSLPHSHPTQFGTRGYLGEDHLARTAAARGEIILDAPVGVEDWNAPGPDLVTIAETKNDLVLKFYDNKAYKSYRNVSTVDSLDKNFDANCKVLRAQWTKISQDPTRPEAQQRLCATAMKLFDGERYERVVTNSGGLAKGISESLRGQAYVV